MGAVNSLGREHEQTAAVYTPQYTGRTNTRKGRGNARMHRVFVNLSSEFRESGVRERHLLTPLDVATQNAFSGCSINVSHVRL